MSPTSSCPRCGRISHAAQAFCGSCGATLKPRSNAKGWKLFFGAFAVFVALMWATAIFVSPGPGKRLAGTSRPRTLVGPGSNSNAAQPAPPAPSPSAPPPAPRPAESDKDSAGNTAAPATRTPTPAADAPSKASPSKPPSSLPGSDAARKSPPAGDAGGASSSDYYTNSRGEQVRRPTFSESGPPAGATAQCRDGSYSFSQSRRGTCSHHGGVSRWL